MSVGGKRNVKKLSAAKDVYQAVQAAEVSKNPRTIDWMDFVAQAFPNSLRSRIQCLRSAINRKVNNPALSPLIHDHIDISEIGTAVPAGHGRDPNNAVALA